MGGYISCEDRAVDMVDNGQGVRAVAEQHRASGSTNVVPPIVIRVASDDSQMVLGSSVESLTEGLYVSPVGNWKKGNRIF